MCVCVCVCVCACVCLEPCTRAQFKCKPYIESHYLRLSEITTIFGRKREKKRIMD